MRRLRKPSLAALAAVTVFCGAYLAGLQITGNFHEVVPGQLYRSAQLTAAGIEGYSQQYGIRTIVNLRGKTNAPWYREEIDASKKAGLVHIDFRMSASRALTMDENRALIAMLRDAPKPILIHCKSGADRTGLVSLIYANQIAGIDEEIAERQLSITYGHIGIPYLSPTFAMDESWERLEAELRMPG